MSKVTLKSAGSLPFMGSVSFPVQVDAEITNTEVAFVRCDALLAIGADNVFELEDAEFMYGFSDFEVVS